MSSRNEDPHHENPDSFPFPSDDSLGLPISPPKTGFPTSQPPDAFTQLHGNPQKPPPPPDEKD